MEMACATVTLVDSLRTPAILIDPRQSSGRGEALGYREAPSPEADEVLWDSVSHF